MIRMSPRLPPMRPKMTSDSYRINVSGYVNDDYVDIAGTAVIATDKDGNETLSDFLCKEEFKFEEVRMG